MNEARKMANDAVKVIQDHYPEFLTTAEVEDSMVNQLGYYIAVLDTVRNDPLPDEAAESILEAKLSKKIFHLRNKIKEEIRKTVACERKKQAAQN